MALAAIEQDIPVHELLHLAQLEGGELELLEAQIGDESPAIGRKPSDIELPDGCSLFVLIRGEQAVPIKPETIFQTGDKVLAISRTDCEADLHRQLIGTRLPRLTRPGSAAAGGGRGRRAHRTGPDSDIPTGITAGARLQQDT